MIKSKATKTGDIIIAIICILILFICLLPLINVLARSLSSSEALLHNDVFLWPKGLNFDAYSTVLSDHKYVYSLQWTAILTVVCTLLSLAMTIMCAYPLTYEQLKGRKFFNFLILLTMYFSAGTIPHYLLIKNLNILNTPYALIVPNCLSVFNMIILRSFFYGISESMREAAEIDGAGPIRILARIYLPLSTPALATLALFYAVGRWNGFSDALLYVFSESKLYPIQLLLYNILKNTTSIEISTQEGFFPTGIAETLKMATVMIATIPIVIIYPWLQRYFISGVSIGAVKE